MVLAHRPEIDGLRAVAVLPVILYHAGFGTFPGGFVGVDVFFVISGYLITSLILSEMSAGSFSLGRFYERRARRILPALFVVMAACLPWAWWWLDPVDLKDFAKSLVAVPLFASNLLFWREGGYFSIAAEFKPLLHTWSLALEEQYYLLFPLFVMLVWPHGRRRLVVLLAVAALLSLGLAQLGATYKPEASFLLLPTRGWELAVGCLASLWQQHPSYRRAGSAWAQGASALGLVAIVCAVLLFDQSTHHPGLPTLVPALGTALVLLHAGPDNWTGRLLAARGPVGLGLVSYSAYLWHQPMFAFYRLRMLADPPPVVALGLVVLALVLATLSWRFVEQPFRLSQAISRRQVAMLTLGASFAFVSLGLAGWATEGFAARQAMPPAVARSFDITRRSTQCFDAEVTGPSQEWLCRIGDDKQPPDFMVFGDSHANSLFESFDQAARLEGRQGFFAGMSSCPPLLGVHLLRGWQFRRSCFELNQRVHDVVSGSGVKTVVLVAKWTAYTDGGYDGKHLVPIGLQRDDPPDLATSRAAFLQGLKNTAESFGRMGVTVVVVGQVPQQKVSPRRVVHRALAQGVPIAQALREASVGLPDHLRLQSFVTDVVGRTPGLVRLSLDAALCENGLCLAGDAGGGFYFDEDHYSVHGARRLDQILRATLRP